MDRSILERDALLAGPVFLWDLVRDRYRDRRQLLAAPCRNTAPFSMIMNARPKSNGARIQNKGVNYETSFHVARVSSTAS